MNRLHVAILEGLANHDPAYRAGFWRGFDAANKHRVALGANATEPTWRDYLPLAAAFLAGCLMTWAVML